MSTGLLHLHSSLRYVILAMLIISIIVAFGGTNGKKAFTEGNRKLFLFTMIFTHIQLLIGLLLYVINKKYEVFTEGLMSVPEARFYGLEHLLMMLIALTLITIGHSKSKKATEAAAKFKKIAIFYTIALIIIFVAIPWPFLKEFGSWF